MTLVGQLYANVYFNRGRDCRVGESTWHQHLLIEVATVALAGRLGANIK